MPKSQIWSSPIAKFRAEAARQNNEADAANQARRAKRLALVLAQTPPSSASESVSVAPATPLSVNTPPVLGEPLLYHRARLGKLHAWLDREVLREGPLTETEAKLVTRVGALSVYDSLRDQLAITDAFNMPAARATVMAMGDYTTPAGQEELKRAYNEVAARLGCHLFDLTEAVAYTTA